MLFMLVVVEVTHLAGVIARFTVLPARSLTCGGGSSASIGLGRRAAVKVGDDRQYCDGQESLDRAVGHVSGIT